MTDAIRQHFLAYGPFTYPGLYSDCFRALPDDPGALSRLLSKQIIHRVTLAQGNRFANADLRYGDLTCWPWYRGKCEDDIYLSAPAIAAGLFRLDERGFMEDRRVEDKLVLTCRFVSVLVSSIYKAKGIPCRSRAGFAPYFRQSASVDHWINQLWSEAEDRWITFDADGLYDGLGLPFTPYDMDSRQFDWAAEVWLGIRSGAKDGARFVYADNQGTCGLRAAARYLVYDFHALMNNELSYVFQPRYLEDFLRGRAELGSKQMEELDRLAELLLEPEENFQELTAWWETRRYFRELSSPLV